MLENIIFFTFLGIFVLTAVIALFSLPGWIKIPDKYRSKLFTALILEVVGCMIILFKVYFIDNDKDKQDLIKLPNDMAIINIATGKICDGFITSEGELVQKDLDDNKKKLIQKIDYQLQEGDDCLVVKPKEDMDIILGKIASRDIKRIGYYNFLEIADNVDDIAIVEYYPFSTKKEPRGLYQLSKFPITIKVDVEATKMGVFYKCCKVNENQEKEEIISIRPVDKRKPGVFKHKDCYYFMHVIKADFGVGKFGTNDKTDMTDDDKYVRFIFVKFKSDVKFPSSI